MGQDINMSSVVSALSTASRVGKSDRQQHENEKRRKKREKKGNPAGQIQDLIEIEAQASKPERSDHRTKSIPAASTDKRPERQTPKVNIKI